MSKKIRYTDGPIGIDQVKVIKDFLPPPEELVFRTEDTQVSYAKANKPKPPAVKVGQAPARGKGQRAHKPESTAARLHRISSRTGKGVGRSD